MRSGETVTADYFLDRWCLFEVPTLPEPRMESIKDDPGHDPQDERDIPVIAVMVPDQAGISFGKIFRNG